MKSPLFKDKYKKNNGTTICPVCFIEFYKGNMGHTYCTKKCLDKATRMKNQAIVHKYKTDNGCEICGYNAHPVALQFDHKKPEDKAFNISLDYKRPIDQMMKEIAKCRVLCANCHSIETYNNKHYTLDMSKRGYVSGNINYRLQTKRKG